MSKNPGAPQSADAIADGEVGEAAEQFQLMQHHMVDTALAVALIAVGGSPSRVTSAKRPALKEAPPPPMEPFVPESYWASYAPKQVTPGQTRMTHIRRSSRTGAVEESIVVYDKFGRIKYRIDKTDHLRPADHTNPHLHEFKYGPGYTPYLEVSHDIALP